MTTQQDGGPVSYVVVQKVWCQVSADCDTVERARTVVVSPETTVAEIMRWASNCNVIGQGDVAITEQDADAMLRARKQEAPE